MADLGANRFGSSGGRASTRRAHEPVSPREPSEPFARPRRQADPGPAQGPPNRPGTALPGPPMDLGMLLPLGPAEPGERQTLSAWVTVNLGNPFDHDSAANGGCGRSTSKFPELVENVRQNASTAAWPDTRIPFGATDGPSLPGAGTIAARPTRSERASPPRPRPAPMPRCSQRSGRHREPLRWAPWSRRRDDAQRERETGPWQRKASQSKCHAESKHRRPSSSRSWRILNVTRISTDPTCSRQPSSTDPSPPWGTPSP